MGRQSTSAASASANNVKHYIRICSTGRLTASAEHLLVTGQLHFHLTLESRNMHQRIEPVQRTGNQLHKLHVQISALAVRNFVGKSTNKSIFAKRNIGKHNFAPKDSECCRRVNPRSHKQSRLFLHPIFFAYGTENLLCALIRRLCAVQNFSCINEIRYKTPYKKYCRTCEIYNAHDIEYLSQGYRLLGGSLYNRFRGNHGFCLISGKNRCIIGIYVIHIGKNRCTGHSRIHRNVPGIRWLTRRDGICVFRRRV